MNNSVNKPKRILWSPHGHQKFIVGSSDLRLYEYKKDSENPFQMIAVNSDIQLMKCFSWFPGELEDLCAVGLANGRTMLTRVRDSKVITEFVPKYSRSCNVVCFSSISTHTLASGLDKVRNDNCLFVWDVNQEQNLRQYGSSEAITSIAWLKNTPSLLGSGMGLKWLRFYDIRNDSPTVVIGTKAVYGLQVDPLNSFRFASFSEEGLINIWDLRKTTEPLLLLNPESKSGCVRISFSQKRHGLLASLSKDSSSLQLWDIQSGVVRPEISNYFVDDDDYMDKLSALEQDHLRICNQKNPFSYPNLWKVRQTNSTESTIASFSWTTTDLKELSMISVGTNGAFNILSVKEAFKFSWNSKGSVSFSNDDSVFLSPLIDDISLVMQSRVRNGYCLSQDLNGSIAQDYAWSIIKRMESLFKNAEDKDFLSDYQNLIYHGVSMCSKINLISKKKPSKIHKSVTEDLEKQIYPTTTTTAMAYTSALNHQNSFTPSNLVNVSSDPVYQQYPSPPEKFWIMNEDSFLQSHAYRVVALCLCGYNWNEPDYPSKLISIFEGRSELDRAAFWSLMFGKISSCLRILQSSTDERYHFIAAALASGYPSLASNSSAWNDSCKSLSRNLKEPFLKAIFLYLSNGGSHLQVVKEIELPLEDRVGIALRFLQDDDLCVFLNELEEYFLKKGDLRGLLLSGFSFPSCTKLLQSYLDQTGDIQTAALIMNSIPHFCFVGTSFAINEMNCEGSTVEAASLLMQWTDHYQSLLNQWGMFEERCKMDINRRKKFESSKLSKEVIATQLGKAFDLLKLAISPSTLSNNSSKQNLVESSLVSTYNIPAQVFVRCSFCNQSLSNSQLLIPTIPGNVSTTLFTGNMIPSQTSNIMNGTGSGLLHVSPRIQQMGCFSCKKPLPRCAICLSAIGCEVNERYYIEQEKMKPTDSWFSWCQNCRHGGHSLHLQQWFVKHQECPVSGCKCKCSLLF